MVTHLCTLLLYCGQVDTVKHLITEYKVEIDARNNQSSDTQLNVMAAFNGQIDIVKIMVDEFNCSPFVQGFREWNSPSLLLVGATP